MSSTHALNEVRAGIDAVDAELVGLLARRQALVRAAARSKKDEDAVRAPDRVERVFAAARAKAAAEGLAPELAEAVWRALIAAFINLELTEHRAVEGP
ncbi:chorismate mutase [Streptomyces sp. NPDC059851]|uniref:chorismate mutase n=1 Tax=Streptomyces sp. NPDC059851 TaxID=3346971 RepID=UPI00364B4D2A